MTLVLDDKQMKQAIKALISHSQKVKESGATRQLFEDEGEVLNLQIALKKIPEKVSEKPVNTPASPMDVLNEYSIIYQFIVALIFAAQRNNAYTQVRIELPYSLFPVNGEVCLIVKDPQRVYKDRVRYAAIFYDF
jgi:hypothetical protein